ncbi:MAG: DUF4249 family protein [Longimicrobiales bacterium]
MATTTRRPVRRGPGPSRLRQVLRLPVWAAILMASAACELTSVEEIEPEDVVVVEAYLRPGGTQEVFVHRTLPGQDGSLRVDGATVELVGADGRGGERRSRLQVTNTTEECASPAALLGGPAGTCYLGLFSASPNQEYGLEVTTADGRRLEGTTTMPGDFGIRVPTADTCSLETDRLDITWTQAEGAWSYQVVARFTGLAEGLAALGVEDPPDELELTGLAIGRADTTIVFPNEFGVFDRFTMDPAVLLALQQGLPGGASADIVVAAGDENFVNWVRGGNFNPSGQVRVPSIVGDGTGVFGSLVTRRVTVLSQTPGYPFCQ